MFLCTFKIVCQSYLSSEWRRNFSFFFLRMALLDLWRGLVDLSSKPDNCWKHFVLICFDRLLSKKTCYTNFTFSIEVFNLQEVILWIVYLKDCNTSTADQQADNGAYYICCARDFRNHMNILELLNCIIRSKKTSE